MHKHKLTKSDRWFVEKGQVDTLSRTPFAVGHEIVVCDHKHVMLADFYDGSCPICHSTITVAFGHSAVEYPKPPKPKEEFLKWFFPTKIACKVIPKVNVALGWVLGILIAAVVILVATGILSNASFLERIDTLLIPRTELLLSRIGGFWFSESVAQKFTSSGTVILTRNGAIFANAITVLSVLGAGLWGLLTAIWGGFLMMFERSKVLFEHVGVRTQHLVELIAYWVNGLIDRFT